MNNNKQDSNTQDRRTRSIRRLFQIGMDRAEPAIEWTIRLCGWSAILFVFAIFVFVFSEGVPIFFATQQVAIVASDNVCNDLVFRAAGGEDDFEGTEIVFRPAPGQSVSLTHDAAAGKLTVDYDPGVTAAGDIVAAAEADEEFAALLTVFPDPEDISA